MQALSWAANFPTRVGAELVIAASARLRRRTSRSTRSAARRFMADPKWKGATITRPRYKAPRDPTRPRGGADGGRNHVSVAKPADREFGRRLQDRDAKTFGFDPISSRELSAPPGAELHRPFRRQLVSLHYPRMDYFDLAEEHGGLAQAFAGTSNRFCLVSFDTDWLYPTSESRSVVHAHARALRSASSTSARRTATTASARCSRARRVVAGS